MKIKKIKKYNILQYIKKNYFINNKEKIINNFFFKKKNIKNQLKIIRKNQKINTFFLITKKYKINFKIFGLERQHFLKMFYKCLFSGIIIK